MKLLNLTYTICTLCCLLGQVYGQTDTLDAHLHIQQDVHGPQLFSVASDQQMQPLASSAPIISYGPSRSMAVNQEFDWSPSNNGGTVEFGVTVEQTFTGFYNPLGSGSAPDGTLYIANTGYHSIMKRTSGGVQTVFAGGNSTSYGYVNGTGTAARFRHPSFLAVDASGNIFVADQQNHRIRKITPSGVVTTFAGSGSIGSANGTGTAASFNYPMGLAFDASGNLYVADAYNHRIRKITPAGVVSTYAGSGASGLLDGTLSAARFSYPIGLSFDGNGDLYVADRSNFAIRKISGDAVTTVAGNGTAGSVDGTGAAARFQANGLVVDKGNLYFVDQTYNGLKHISPSGQVVTISASGQFTGPFSISRGPDGKYHIAENTQNRIKKVAIVAAYSISPALPPGLLFDRYTGKISGKLSSVRASQSYTVTARNNMGSSTSTVTFSVATGDGPAVSSDQNYILETIPRQAYSSVSAMEGEPVGSVNRRIQYFDGLGRPLQNVEWQGSPSKKDVVQHIEYDGFGRESHKYLPYVDITGDGSYKAGGSPNVTDFYTKTTGSDIAGVVRTPKPFAVTVFENSPLNRIKEQGGPGEIWQPAAGRTPNGGRTVVTEYGTNLENDVRLWRLNGSGALGGKTYYAPGRLYKTVVKDENWDSGNKGTVEEYKDFEDRVVLKRVWESESNKLETQYVYDDFGDLRYIIPPAVTTDTLTVKAGDPDFWNYVYAYRYDGRRRLIEKKIPGRGWEHIVYNRNDQPVLTQDSVQRIKPVPEWSYTKYDALGRVTETGIFRRNLSRSALQDTLNLEQTDASRAFWETRGHNALSYDNKSYPRGTSTKTVLTVNYYDDYGFKASTVLAASTNLDSTRMVKGLLTGTKVSKDDGSTPLLSVNYYDKKARLIETISNNHLGGTDRITNTYNFPGELLTSNHEHKASPTGTATTILTTNIYDHVGRLVETKKKVGSQPEIIQSRLAYNGIGQLITKALHVVDDGTDIAEDMVLDGSDVINPQQTYEKVATSSITLKPGFHAPLGSSFHASIVPGGSLQTIQYTYNPQGWLKSASSKDFESELYYEDGSVPQYNGNISEQHWKHDDEATKHFVYSYDGLNRLEDGNSVNGGMHEQLAYDDMGNITKLTRDGTEINYTYTGNRLISLSGGLGGSYLYDANGNVTKDRMGTNLTYNHLNLPKTANRTQSGANPAVAVQYLYDAVGTKLRMTSTVGGTITTRDYVAGIEYSKVGSAASAIEMIHTEEGYLQRNASNNTYTYHYNLTDHLGNVRATLQQSTGEVIQKHDYYPFGKAKALVTSGINKYLYNGKEIQDELGGQYDYGARFYDAEIGRWNVVDPLAEIYSSYSPYAYVENNPISFIDPTGMYKVDANGNINITDQDEIKRFLGFLNSNPNAGFKESSDHIRNADNGFRLELDEVIVTRRSAFEGGGWVGSVESQASDAMGRMSNATGVYWQEGGRHNMLSNPNNVTMLEMPGYIGGRAGINTVYKGIKGGLPYIGKSFNILNRYSKAERELMKIKPILSGINYDAKLLRAVEQTVLKFMKSKGPVSNMRNAFSSKRKDYAEYMEKAAKWLEKNAPNWKDMF